MAKYIVVKEPKDPDQLLIFTIVVLLVAVIGFMTYTPPERPYHSFIENNQKTQYITIGGESKTTVSPNG